MSKEDFPGQQKHTWTRLEKLNLRTDQQQDAANYEMGTVVEFYRRAAGGFKSGEQWQAVGQHGRSQILVGENGQQRFLPLSKAGNFNVFRTESLSLSAGHKVLCTVTAIDEENIPTTHHLPVLGR